MEAKKTKILALAVLAMLCAVAIVGAAYAAFAGTAKTYNEGNNAISGNILIGNASFDPMISPANPEVYETYSAESGVVYYFSNGGDDVNGYTAKTVGSSKDLTITNNTGAEITKLTFTVKATEDISNSEFKYFFAVTIGTATVYTTAVSTADASATITIPDQDNGTEGVQGIADEDSVTMTIQLYIGYVADKAIPDTFIGDIVNIPQDPTGYVLAKLSANGPADIDDVDFGFTIADATA